MKYIFCFLFLSISITALAQNWPTEIYIENGKAHNRSYRDSVGRANFFIREKYLRTSGDTVFYSFTHFEKSLFASNLENLGMFCGNSDRKKTQEIVKTDPFNKITSVMLVSFKVESDTALRETPKINGEVDLTRMFEQRILGDNLKNKLLDVLVNYDDKSNEPNKILLCYEPRNAIVFLNKKNKIIGHIELCFQCWQYRIYFDNLKIGTFCTEKLDVIQGFFMHEGIKYGMKYNED